MLIRSNVVTRLKQKTKTLDHPLDNRNSLICNALSFSSKKASTTYAYWNTTPTFITIIYDAFSLNLTFKNPHRIPTEPMGIHHSPHTHPIPIPIGIPMGIPIPTAALIIVARLKRILSQPQSIITFSPVRWSSVVEKLQYWIVSK